MLFWPNYREKMLKDVLEILKSKEKSQQQSMGQNKTKRKRGKKSDLKEIVGEDSDSRLKKNKRRNNKELTNKKPDKAN